MIFYLAQYNFFLDIFCQVHFAIFKINSIFAAIIQNRR